MEAVSSWVSPDSLLMSGMSTLFQLSVWIRGNKVRRSCSVKTRRGRHRMKMGGLGSRHTSDPDRDAHRIGPPAQYCHNYLVEDVGLPVWGSYIIFGFMTLFLGLVLGMVLVFVADYLCPTKRQRPQGFSSPSECPHLPQARHRQSALLMDFGLKKNFCHWVFKKIKNPPFVLYELCLAAEPVN
ncbi:unnamed protein product [Ranitomeya imitator]|uniref:Uncharacterized protein n=1 Tax=Ranitomeya imitator TaxID=111125 RepID=A0ABN9KXM2_9NEOB|nr:unnamed protein product [Ranitomeya imitator]